MRPENRTDEQPSVTIIPCIGNWAIMVPIHGEGLSSIIALQAEPVIAWKIVVYTWKDRGRFGSLAETYSM
jgi:hypothetical protein